MQGSLTDKHALSAKRQRLQGMAVARSLTDIRKSSGSYVDSWVKLIDIMLYSQRNRRIMNINGNKLLSGGKVVVDEGIGRAPYSIMIKLFVTNSWEMVSKALPRSMSITAE